MKLAHVLRRWADRVDPPQASANEPEDIIENESDVNDVLDIPPGAKILSDKAEITTTPGHSGMHFRRRLITYETADGQIKEIFLKENVLLSGCGHNLLRSADVAFVSKSSDLPICKACEKQYNRMRAQTRHEHCKCWHLVAPHELTRVEGYGYLCEECLKEHNKLSIGKVIIGILKCLSIIQEENPMENSNENTPFPPTEDQYPPLVQRTPLSWPEHPPYRQKYHEMPGAEYESPPAHRLPPKRN